MTIESKLEALDKAFDGDKDLLLFFLSWLKNGQNGVKAYQELNPDTDYASAAVLASRLLKKVKIESILSVYGLDADAYFRQLKGGLEANRTISTISGKEANGGTVDFIDVPDHKTRKDYHDKLGKLLGYEVAANSVLAADNRTQIVNNYYGATDMPAVFSKWLEVAPEEAKEALTANKSKIKELIG